MVTPGPAPVSPAEQRIRDDLMAELREFMIGRDLVHLTQILRCVNQSLREGAAEASAAEQPLVH
jgi:hypothetical protein